MEDEQPNSPSLPETAQVVADVIGREATLALAAKCQYKNLYVPKKGFEIRDWVTKAIGPAKAEKLVKIFGGESLPLPKCFYVYQQQRNLQMRQAYASGKTVQEIAEAFLMSLRNASRIVHPEQAERNRAYARERKRARATHPPIGTSDGGLGEGGRKLAGKG